jgi:uncharacterized protein (TIGR02246 family)
VKHYHSSLFTVVLLDILLVSASTSAQPPAKKPAAAPKPAANTGAAPTQDASAAELAAIRAASEAFTAAFNKGDAKSIAAMWTEDGEYMDESGRRFEGRAAIEQAYADVFAANPGAQIEIAIDSLRLLSKDTALEEGRAVAQLPAGGQPGVSKYSAVHVRVDGKWLMAAVRDMWIDAPATEWSAADLQWLVGTWTAEEQGVKTQSVVQWVVDGRFLERTYTTTQLDGTTTTGVQLIGWNPQEGRVQSWNFSPDGGHAIGTWLPSEGGWHAHMHGTTGDGAPTSSINLLKRLDDNAYVWQSVHRTVGGVTLPDTPEIVWKRQPPTQ